MALGSRLLETRLFKIPTNEQVNRDLRMARLYLLRRGTGDDRIASSFEVSAERVRSVYGTVRTHSTNGLPTINDDPANPVADHEFAVIELRKDEKAFGMFRSPGFNLLDGVESKDAYQRLVKEGN